MSRVAVPSHHRRRRWLQILALVGLGAAIVSLTACSGLSALNLITPSTGYRATEAQAYGSDERQKLDIYVPEGTAPAGGFPVVVFFYGGSWREGSRTDYRFVAQALAQRGVMTVIPDYRVYPQADWRGILSDCAQATAWVQRQVGRFGGDPKRIVVAGHSAGAYNAAMIALDPRWLKESGSSPALLAGWAGISGPYDFTPIKNPDVIPVFGGPQPPAESQPIFHARAPGLPRLPALLLAGTDDKVVDPQRNTAGLAHVLSLRGVAVKEEEVPGLSHAGAVAAFAWPLRGKAPVLDRLSDFVLKLPS